MSEEIPDSVIVDFVHTSVRDGKPVFRLEAGRAEVYNKREETRLFNVYFQEYARDGAVATEGWAEKTIFFTDTENAEMAGDLLVYSSSEEAFVGSDYLYWDDSARTLTSRRDSAVTIEKDDGTTLRGLGFRADMATRSVEFSGSVSGTYVSEDDSEEE
jgi:LPS export ABC transporter protein LptC